MAEAPASDTPSSSGAADAAPPVWKRVVVSCGTVALGSYVAFEALYLTTTLQRLGVRASLLALSGVISGAAGVLLLLVLGWANDRFPDKKRLLAAVSALLFFIGVAIITALCGKHAYRHDTTIIANNSNHNTFNNVKSFSSGIDISNNSLSNNNNTIINKSNNGTISTQVPSLTTAVNNDLHPTISPTMKNDSLYQTSTSLAAMTIIAFVVSDQGLVLSYASFRIFRMSIATPSQHASLRVSTALMGAFGGGVTSVLGYADLTNLFPRSRRGGEMFDIGSAQCLVQGGIVWMFLVLFALINLAVDSKFLQTDSQGEASLPRDVDFMQTDYEVITEEDEEDIFSIDDHESDLLASRKHRNRPGEKTYQSGVALSNSSNKATSPASGNGYTPSLPPSSSTNPSSAPATVSVALNSETPAPQEGSNLVEKKISSLCATSANDTFWQSFWRRKRRIVSLFAVIFCSVTAMTSYFFFIANYVAEIVYGGNPHARPGSDAYNDYVTGVRMASLSLLPFFVAFAVYSLIRDRVLDRIGLDAEFNIASFAAAALTMTLALTENLAVVFVNTVPLAVYACHLLFTPSLLSSTCFGHDEYNELPGDTDSITPGATAIETDHHQRILTEEDRSINQSKGEDAPASQWEEDATTVVTSLSVMQMTSLCVICLVLCAALGATGNTALPIFISSGAFFAGMLAALFVKSV